MNDDLRPLMTKLPEPAPPSALTAIVMARIAREDGRARAPRLSGVRGGNGRFAWLWATAGLALLLAGEIVRSLETGSLFGVTSGSFTGGGQAPLPTGESGTLLVGLGMLLYFVGLFTPLRSRRTTRA